jgi:hypothetical protein
VHRPERNLDLQQVPEQPGRLHPRETATATYAAPAKPPELIKRRQYSPVPIRRLRVVDCLGKDSKLEDSNPKPK